MKQYIIIRNDKKIPIGKIIAHVGHNVLDAYLHGTFNDRMSNKQIEWRSNNYQTKIVVEADMEKISQIERLAEKYSIAFSCIPDILYQYHICAVVGPVTDLEIKILRLKDLPLYKG